MLGAELYPTRRLLERARACFDRIVLSAQIFPTQIAVGGSQGQEDKVSDVVMSEKYRALAEKVFATDDRPIILYDGICNLCNGGVNFMLDWDSPNEERGNFRFAALQSDVGHALLTRSGRKPTDCNSIILALKDGSTYAKGDAVFRIGQGIGRGTVLDPFAPIAARVASAVVPSVLRDALYDFVAVNRYNWFGEAPECRLWDDRFDERFVGELEVLEPDA